MSKRSIPEVLCPDLVEKIIANPKELASFPQSSDIHMFLDASIQFLESIKEPSLIEYKAPGDLIVIGDIHGDLKVVLHIIKRFFPPKLRESRRLLFLGDLTDRAPKEHPYGSISTITYLMALKMKYPHGIHMLMGNHEATLVAPYLPSDLPYEVDSKYHDGKQMVPKFHKLLSLFPLMARSENGLFASHGGFPKGSTLGKLRKITRRNKKAVEWITWAVPKGLGFYRGIEDCEFDGMELKEFLDGIGSRVYIRGHDPSLNGSIIFGERCLTIFSSRLYARDGNWGILVARCDLERDIMNAFDLELWDMSRGKWRRYKPNWI